MFRCYCILYDRCHTLSVFHRGRATYSSLAFVPKHDPVCEDEINQVRDFINSSKKTLVLTGAGISTESGIPDYRSEGVGLYARSSRRPVQYNDFVRSEAIRRRYWARNFVGWPQFSSISPNATHYAIRNLELDLNRISYVITQNVDNLHYKAGSQKVIELHGTAYRVMCLSCNFKMKRHKFQEILSEMNPGVQLRSDEMKPDGDVEIREEDMESFKVPSCFNCGGILKPDIVFFGDNVPKERVNFIKQQISTSDSLLVLGSSLSVFSGFRFILHASELGKPIAIINIGETRGDKYAQLKIEKKCGDLLPRLYC
ncbi:NAD-dependent protein deacylase Sirt4 [Anabrus simplex]|uniref:NAD-dependent protein deacylase Sirt4 n=1 Tax=Anabrus simplex TaxID=316456 RepID=UPI0035A36AF6